MRYPGGKSRALAQIGRCLPASFASCREPFVGGGSVFIHLKQQRPELDVWINALNHDLYCFWRAAQADAEKLAAEVARVRARRRTGGRCSRN
ncbi:MAG TPA: DNA adenine methylase [Pyrinomonadaceae bacterium]